MSSVPKLGQVCGFWFGFLLISIALLQWGSSQQSAHLWYAMGLRSRALKLTGNTGAFHWIKEMVEICVPESAVVTAKHWPSAQLLKNRISFVLHLWKYNPAYTEIFEIWADHARKVTENSHLVSSFNFLSALQSPSLKETSCVKLYLQWRTKHRQNKSLKLRF